MTSTHPVPPRLLAWLSLLFSFANVGVAVHSEWIPWWFAGLIATFCGFTGGLMWALADIEKEGR